MTVSLPRKKTSSCASEYPKSFIEHTDCVTVMQFQQEYAPINEVVRAKTLSSWIVRPLSKRSHNPRKDKKCEGTVQVLDQEMQCL